MLEDTDRTEGMENPPPADGAPERRKQRRKLVALIMAIALVSVAILAGTALWYAYLRPLTWREVVEETAWPVGARDFEDVITNVTIANTSYGPVTFLGFPEGQSTGICATGIVADPSTTYRVGDRYRTTLHFQAYEYDGAPAVWAPELVCPFPVLWSSIGTVLDAVSFVMGTVLLYQGTDADGWTTYDLLTQNGDRFPASDVPLSLRREPNIVANITDPAPVGTIDSAADWIVVAAYEYVSVTGGYRPAWEVDRMDALADGTSVNGTVRFVDVDGDGFAGDGDQIRVRLPSLGEGEYQTYFLSLGGGMAGSFSALASAVKEILNGPHGPYEAFLASGPNPSFPLRYEGGEAGPPTTATIGIGRIFRGTPQPFADYRFAVVREFSEPPYQQTEVEGAVGASPVVGGNLTVSFQDEDGDGRLSSGDRFTVSGLTNQTRYLFRLTRGGFGTAASLEWFAGYGHVSGRIPSVQFAVSGANPYAAQANVSYRHPELALNRTVRASLWEDSVLVLDHVTVRDGANSTWAGGSLTFTDTDGDGALSTGDRFLLAGTPGARYRLEVSLLFGAYVFPIDVPP